MKKMRKIGFQMEGQKFLVTTNLFHGGGFSFTLFHGLRLAKKIMFLLLLSLLSFICLSGFFVCYRNYYYGQNDGPISNIQQLESFKKNDFAYYIYIVLLVFLCCE